jgi:hypothetical protein
VKQIGPEISAPFFSDLNNLSSAQRKHSKSQTHVDSYLQLKLFGKQQRVEVLLDAQSRNDVTSITNKEKKNILILLRFIDAVCSSANKEFPFQGHDESSIS